MFRAIIVSCVLIVITGNISYAGGGNKAMCQRFFSKWNLRSCMDQQKKSSRKYSEWSSMKRSDYGQWADQCREENYLRDRATRFINYYGVEKCVNKLKDRQDELDAIAKQKTIININ